MIETEKKITLSQAVILLPRARGQKPKSAISVWRWCREGLRSRAGEVIRLEHVRCGRTLFTSREALARFQSRLAAADTAHWEKLPIASPPRRNRDRMIERAQRRVAAKGI